MQTLKAGGHRITRARKAILEMLIAHEKPLSVDEVMKKLARKGLEPNKTTVYRELDMLVQNGFIADVRLKSGSRLYEIASRKHHHHLVCIRCKTIRDIPMENDMNLYEKKISRKTAFKILEHSLEFFGLCIKCQST